MRTMLILFLLSGLAAEATSFTHTRDTLSPCYVANTAVIWHGNPEYTIHRIVTTGIRRYDDAGGGTIAHCAPRDSTDLAANRAALARIVDSIHLAPPLVMTRMELTVQSLELIRSQLVSLHEKAKTHSDGFVSTEIIDVRRSDGSEAPEVPLPALSETPLATQLCKTRNDSLHRAGSLTRLAC